MDYVLTGYPLSNDFRESFESKVGCNPEYFTVSDLRKLALPEMLIKLRSLKCNIIYVVLEDTNSGSTLSVLKILASIPPARLREIVLPDFSRIRLSRFDGLISTARIIFASIASVWSAVACNVQLRWLIKQRITNVTLRSTGNVMHLNANLWVGFQAGGSIGHVAGVANALLGKGYGVDCYSATGKGMISKSANYSRVSLSTYGVPFELNNYRFHRYLVNRLQKIEKRKYTFIYQRMSLGNYTGVNLSRRWRVPLVLEYNGSEAWIAKHWGKPLRHHDLAVLAEEVCFKHSHVIVVVSEVLKDELVQRGVDANKIVCYPNCIDPKMFDPKRFGDEQHAMLRTKYGLSSDTVVLTFLGTFGQWHGTEVLAEAIKQLAENESEWLKREKVHFMLIGEGYKLHQVKKILSPDYCKPFYTLTGVVPQGEAPRYLAAADVLLSPHIANEDGTRFFGSPTKLFEYMAMGKGIVASDLDQIGEVLKNSIHSDSLTVGEPSDNERRLSVLVPPGNVAALVKGIRFLVENKSWRDTLGANARAEALLKYTWEHHVEAILDRVKTI